MDSLGNIVVRNPGANSLAVLNPGAAMPTQVVPVEIPNLEAAVDSAIEPLIGTATANFDTLGEIEQQVTAVSTNLSELEAQVAALDDAPDYVLYFRNALI